MVWTNEAGWTEEEIVTVQRTEQNMNEVLTNPSSTYTEQCEAIDEFFDSW